MSCGGHQWPCFWTVKDRASPIVTDGLPIWPACHCSDSVNRAVASRMHLVCEVSYTLCRRTAKLWMHCQPGAWHGGRCEHRSVQRRCRNVVSHTGLIGRKAGPKPTKAVTYAPSPVGVPSAADLLQTP
jgi:hypothetical protein